METDYHILVERVDEQTWHVWRNIGPGSDGVPRFEDNYEIWPVSHQDGYLEKMIRQMTAAPVQVIFV